MYEIKAKKIPKSLGPYSQGLIFNNLIFISGQIALNSDNFIIADNITDQTKQILENIKKIVEHAGSNINNIIKTTIYLKDINDISIVNIIYKNFFDKNNSIIYPVRSCIEVTNLPKNALILIDVIAHI